MLKKFKILSCFVVWSIIILIIVSGAYGASLNSNIINGRRVVDATLEGNLIVANNTGEFPYVVSIRRYNLQHCGGFIIQRNAVITAGHCVINGTANDYMILAGTMLHDLPFLGGYKQVRNVSEISKHTHYNGSVGHVYDIAILFLAGDLDFNGKTVAPINLKLTRSYHDFIGEAIVAVGWGVIWHKGPSTATLKAADLLVLHPKICRQKSKYFDEAIMICAIDPHHNSTDCSGDSGGPLVKHNAANPLEDVVVGIISWGISRNCNASVPSAYTDIKAMLPWIDWRLQVNSVYGYIGE